MLMDLTCTQSQQSVMDIMTLFLIWPHQALKSIRPEEDWALDVANDGELKSTHLKIALLSKCTYLRERPKSSQCPGAFSGVPAQSDGHPIEHLRCRCSSYSLWFRAHHDCAVAYLRDCSKADYCTPQLKLCARVCRRDQSGIQHQRQPRGSWHVQLRQRR